MQETKEYKYPLDLQREIKAAWPKIPAQELARLRPLPPDDHILRMLETAFHAGLQTEEGRPLRFRLAYLDPRASDSRATPRRLLPFRSALPLDTDELVKLAPVVDPRRSAIGVFPNASEQPRIWGLVDSGIAAWEGARNFGMADQIGGDPPLSHFEVTVTRPGELIASCGRVHLCTLAAGRLQPPPARLWHAGPLGQYFHAISERFRGTLRSAEVYRPSYLTNLPLYFVESLIGRVARGGHGATVIFVPEGFSAPDSNRAQELRFKYQLDDPSVWDLMRDRFTAEHEYFDNLEAAHTQGTTLGTDDQVSLYLQGEDWRMFGVALQERAELFASMAAVDGAVVLDTHLRLLGFGAEIRTHDDTGLTLTEIVVDGSDTRRPIDGFGTRHRSAFRLCSRDDSVACIVVSSDGPVRGVRRVGSDVRLWPSLSV